MKELQAADDSMDDLGFAPGSSTELAKSSSAKLISRTSTAIKKA